MHPGIQRVAPLELLDADRHAGTERELGRRLVERGCPLNLGGHSSSVRPQSLGVEPFDKLARMQQGTHTALGKPHCRLRAAVALRIVPDRGRREDASGEQPAPGLAVEQLRPTVAVEPLDRDSFVRELGDHRLDALQTGARLLIPDRDEEVDSSAPHRARHILWLISRSHRKCLKVEVFFLLLLLARSVVGFGGVIVSVTSATGAIVCDLSLLTALLLTHPLDAAVDGQRVCRTTLATASTRMAPDANPMALMAKLWNGLVSVVLDRPAHNVHDCRKTRVVVPALAEGHHMLNVAGELVVLLCLRVVAHQIK